MTLTLIFLLPSCAAPEGGCGEVIVVTTSSTADEDGEDVDVGEPCTVPNPENGNVDVTACCPDGYVFLAMGGDANTALCEEEC